MNARKTLLLVALIIMPLVTEGKKPVFSNPVTSFDWPDPTVWTDGTTYYSVATGLRMIIQSKDLVNWSEVEGVKPLTDDALGLMKQVGTNFWAPDVVRIGEKWMMYVTCYNSLPDCGIVCLESESPCGPFEFVGTVTHSLINGIKDSIDPEVVVDSSTGKVWLFFGSTDGIFRVEMTSDGRALLDNPQYTHVAGLTISENPTRARAFEGSYLYRRKGYWYLFVSAGRYNDSSYNIKVGRSASLEGEFVDKDGKKMIEGNGTTILSSDPGDKLFGPGHNGEIFTDSAGHDYIFYHCHSRDTKPSSKRHTYLQRLYWSRDGWPFFGSPKPLKEDLAPKMK